MSDTYYPFLPMDSVQAGKATGGTINGLPVMLAEFEGNLYSAIDRCPHAAARLSEGRVRRGNIICPLHGAQFDLKTGAVKGAQPYPPLTTFPVRVIDGWVHVAIPDAPVGE